MKKSLLAAAFAAAFVMSGGLALGADATWDGNDYKIGGNAVVADPPILNTGTGTDTAGFTSGAAKITGTGSGTTDVLELDSITVAAGNDLTIGDTGAGINITADNFTGVGNGGITIHAEGSLITTGDSALITGNMTIQGAYDNQGTLTSGTGIYAIGTGTFTNTGTYNLEAGATITNNGAGGGIVNNGLIDVQGVLTGYTGGKGIDNRTSGGIASDDAGVHILMTGDTTNTITNAIAADLVIGGTDGGTKDIGYVRLTGTGQAAGVAFTGATKGLVDLNDADLSAGGVYDAAGADLQVTGTWVDAPTSSLKGANVTVKTDPATGKQFGGVEATAGNVNILTSGNTFNEEVKATSSGAPGADDGKIIVKGDAATDNLANATTFKKNVDGALELSSQAVLDTGAGFNDNIKFVNDTTLTNKSDGSGVGGGGDVDLTGKKIEGKGTIDNATNNSQLTMLSKDGATPANLTSLDANVKIVNSKNTGTAQVPVYATGTITTDNAMLASSYKQYDLSTVVDTTVAGINYDGGYGHVKLTDSLSIENLDWSAAGGGVLEMSGGVADTVKGTINLGLGDFRTNSVFGTLVDAGTTITGDKFEATNAADTNKGTIIADVIIANRPTTPGGTNAKLTNEGTINVSGDTATTVGGVTVKNETLIFGAAANTLENKGTVEMGKTTVINAVGQDYVGTSSQFNNAAGKLNASGEMLATEWGDLMNIIDQTQSAANGGIGEINFSGNLKSSDPGVGSVDNNIALGGAQAGTVTVKDTQNNAATIDVNLANLNMDGNNNQMTGTIRGNKITFNGENGTYGGMVTSLDTITVNKDNVFNGGLTSANGTTIAKDITVAVRNTLSGGATIGDNTVFQVLADATTVPPYTMTVTNGTLKTGYNTIIDFASDGTGQVYKLTADQLGPNAGVIDLAYDPSAPCGGSRLMVNNGGTYTDEVVIDSAGLAAIAFHSNTKTAWNPSPTEVDAYLANQSFESITQSNLFQQVVDTTNGNYVTYSGYRVGQNDATALEQWNKGLITSGLYDKQGMIDEATKQQMYTYANLTQAELDAMTPEQRQLAIIFNNMGGGYWSCLTSGTRESAANSQWATGMDLAGTLEAVNDTVRSFGRAIAKRGIAAAQYDECGNPIDEYCETSMAHRIWAGYTGQWGNQKSRDWDDGYKYDAHGFNVGYDLFASGGMSFGAAYGYSKGDYENKMALADDSKIENHSFGLYGAYTHTSGFYASALATYTRSEYKMNNQFSTYTGTGITGWDQTKYKGNTWSVGGEIGYDYRPYETLTITPSIGVYHYSVKTKNFDTSTRTGMKYSRTQTEMPIDVAVKYDLHAGDNSTLSFVVNGGYAYNFTNKGTKVHEFAYAGDPSQAVAGGTRYVKPGRSGWNVGGGLQFKYKSFDIGADYEYYGRRGYTSHNVNANVGVSF